MTLTALSPFANSYYYYCIESQLLGGDFGGDISHKKQPLEASRSRFQPFLPVKGDYIALAVGERANYGLVVLIGRLSSCEGELSEYVLDLAKSFFNVSSRADIECIALFTVVNTNTARVTIS